jgi:hypothetical protein
MPVRCLSSHASINAQEVELAHTRVRRQLRQRATACTEPGQWWVRGLAWSRRLYGV